MKLDKIKFVKFEFSVYGSRKAEFRVLFQERTNDVEIFSDITQNMEQRGSGPRCLQCYNLDPLSVCNISTDPHTDVRRRHPATQRRIHFLKRSPQQEKEEEEKEEEKEQQQQQQQQQQQRRRQRQDEISFDSKTISPGKKIRYRPTLNIQ